VGARHDHAPRALRLLEVARGAIEATGWKVLSGPVGLELTVVSSPGAEAWDATNHLGGVADVLQGKARLHPSLDASHLGDLRSVALFVDGRQIKEIHYREEAGKRAHYRLRVWELVA
jgi:hypothetical protein